ITVLSNNWEKNGYDKKGTDQVAERLAAETTVNAAFALGPAKESVPGKKNGQLENLIRFVEDWKMGGVKFTYSGSLVALWHSQQATGDFGCCNYYTPPQRDWAYDTLLNTNAPPGTPMGIVIMRGQWSQG
ncbi:MAG: hypothetical protein V3U70_00450, partial [Thermoplasmata archaeon]